MSEKARSIIFSGWSVQRILANEKTQTRRPIKPQPIAPLSQLVDTPELWTFTCCDREWRCPYGRPGDLCYVKETHYRWTGCGDAPSTWIQSPDGERYNARGYIGEGENNVLHDRSAASIKVPSIFMPKWASRITLRIKDIRVERLMDISTEDIRAEGLSPFIATYDQDGYNDFDEVEFRLHFEDLWNSIYAKPKPKKSHGETTHYESYPWSEADRDPRETINGKSHYCYPNCWAWTIDFIKEERT